MDIKKPNYMQKIIDGLLGLMLMALMVFGMTYMIIYGMELVYKPIQLFSMILIFLSVISVIFMNKITILTTLALGVFAGVGCSIYLQRKELLIDIFWAINNEIVAFATWGMDFVRGIPAGQDEYIEYFVMLLAMCIASIVYFFATKRFSFLILFLGSAVIVVFEMIQEQAFHQLSFYILVFTNLIYFFRNRYLGLQKQLDESSYEMYRAFMKVGGGMAAVICAGAVMLAHTYPYKAVWLQGFVNRFGYTEYYYAAESFSVQSAGLQTNDKVLGGDIMPNDVPILVVDTSSPTYLKALSRSIYTGSAWLNPEEEPVVIDIENEKMIDTMEMMETIDWLSGKEESIDELFYKQTVNIRYENISTKSIFVPAQIDTFRITSWERDVFLTGPDALSVETPANKNFSYIADFYEPYASSEAFEEAVRKSKVGFYEELKKNRAANAKNMDQWIQHAAEITETYTQLPEGLPSRVTELAYEITANQDNNYDKVKALESYLATNHYYTLTPGPVTEGRDFVDEFLFENKRGYCTYFASALAVLTRSLGIPSRYVEGYALPQNRDNTINAYIVTNRRAHAWVEVYFEGAGWIRFEATPPYRQSTSSIPMGISMEEAMEIVTPSFSREDIPIIFEQNEIAAGVSKMPLVGFGVFILTFVFYGFRKYRLKKMEVRAAVLYLYKKYLRLLSQQKLSIKDGETEKLFAIRVDEQMRFEGGSLQEITDIYLMARYSQLEMSNEQKQNMLFFKDILLKASKRRLKFLVYAFYKLSYRFL